MACDHGGRGDEDMVTTEGSESVDFELGVGENQEGFSCSG